MRSLCSFATTREKQSLGRDGADSGRGVGSSWARRRRSTTRLVVVLAAAVAVWLDAPSVSAQVAQSTGQAASASPTSTPRPPRSRRKCLDAALVSTGVFAFSAWTFYGIVTATKGHPQPGTTFLGTFSGLSLALSGVL